VLGVRHHDELVTTPAGQHVIGADGLTQGPGDLDDEVVACGVAMLVVDRLQRIEIDDHDGEAGVCLVIGDQARELLHEIAAVREAGEGVGEAGHFQPAIRFFELAVALRELEGAITDLLLEFHAMSGRARNASLLRIPDRQQHEGGEQRVTHIRDRRQPG
jgi:hypothetical protein